MSLADGGLTSITGSTRMLVLTELQQTPLLLGSTMLPTGVVFKFSRENFSAPRGPQQFGVSLRTVREDLPGAEQPTEQVLGWNYEAFTVKGVWDDRHAGKGYAEQTRKDFEQMVKRGNPVRYQFEQLSITGLITKFEFSYVRKEYQTYQFTMSPHFRYDGETVRVDTSKFKRIINDPKTSVAKCRASLEKMKANQLLATLKNNARVHQLLKTGIFARINSVIDTVENGISSAEKLVDKEILGPVENAAKAFNRGVQVLSSAKTAAATLLSEQKSLESSFQMSTNSLTESLKFEGWHRTLAGSTREFVVQADQSQKDLKLRVQPKAKRLHRVRQGESLYQISHQYYGTPHHWREILATNKLKSIILTGGELLEIPELTA